MQLEHNELITLTRLLAHHVGGTGYGPLDVIAEKLLAYAENTEGDIPPPLALSPMKIAGHPDRLGFSCTHLSPGI